MALADTVFEMALPQVFYRHCPALYSLLFTLTVLRFANNQHFHEILMLGHF
jgi:hypothetical protein